jgi:glucose/arabinose dehydrogenase
MLTKSCVTEELSRGRLVPHRAIALLACGAWALSGAAQPIQQGDVVIELETIASGLVAPIGVTHAGDGSGRLFIVEQSGQVLIVDVIGDLLPTPFLDISDRIVVLNPGFDERGLLGLAFHPDYANNGRLFVRYSAPRAGDPNEPCFGTSRGCHSEVLSEFHVTASPNVADPASEIVLFTVEEPQFNHDSGEVAFGPDGLLYFTLGDGGGAHDGLADSPPSHGPIGNGQNINTTLGSILRIDVDSPADPGLAYAIPGDNPFAATDGADEIYAYGLRNPFKFSFDDGPGGDGTLFLADVGQNLFEEVNIIVKGGNYGWVIREGSHCFDPNNPLMPPLMCPDVGTMLGDPLIEPIVDYSHPGSGFAPEGGITVIGGFVYRGTRSPSLVGTYIFGDFAQAFTTPTGSLYYLIEPAPGDFEIRQFQIGLDNRPYGLFLKGFGEGEDGEVYTCGSTALAPFGDTGVVQRVFIRAQPALDIRPGGCPNPLNTHSRGVVPMALLGSAAFDVKQIDVSTITIGTDAERFAATLTGDQEPSPVMTDAGGAGAFTLNADQTSLSYRLEINGLDFDGNQTPNDPADDVVAMHIHNAPAGVNGGVVFGMISPGQDPDIAIDPVAGVVTGSWDVTDASIQNLAEMLDELRAGNLYVNVHTTTNPGGEIRGQILAVQIAPTRTAIEDVGTHTTGALCECNDAGPDGFDDLTLKFRTRAIVDGLGLAGATGVIPLTVSGSLLDGSPFEATDCVRIVPPGDANSDGRVQLNDLSVMLRMFGTTRGARPADGDFDDDGDVDQSDLIVLLSNLGLGD